MLGSGANDKEHAMPQTLNAAVAVVGIDIGKNSFHLVGHDERGAIVLTLSPTSWLASPGVFSLVVEPSRLGRSMRLLRNLPDPYSAPTTTATDRMRSPR
jgi:hypothetical protein